MSTNEIPKISKKSRAMRAFENAFIELLSSEKCSDISISSIVSKSEYSRTAFYSYYEDKNAFIESLLQHEIITVVHSIYDAVGSGSGSLLEDDVYLPALSLFEHVYERRQFYHLLIQDKIDDWDIVRFADNCFQYFRGHFTFPSGYSNSYDLDMHFYLETFRYINCIIYWDKHDFNYSAKYMASQIGQDLIQTKMHSVSGLKAT